MVSRSEDLIDFWERCTDDRGSFLYQDQGEAFLRLNLIILKSRSNFWRSSTPFLNFGELFAIKLKLKLKLKILPIVLIFAGLYFHFRALLSKNQNQEIPTISPKINPSLLIKIALTEKSQQKISLFNNQETLPLPHSLYTL